MRTWSESMPVRVFKSSLALALIASVFLLGAGCSKGEPRRPKVTISGSVKLDGKPLGLKTIQFSSAATGDSASTLIGEDGNYEIVFEEGDVGATYDVTVYEPQDASVSASDLLDRRNQGNVISTVPLKYSDRSKSGLKAVVSQAGANTYDVEITSK